MDKRATTSGLIQLWIYLSCLSSCWAQFNAGELLDMCTGRSPLRKNYVNIPNEGKYLFTS